MPQFVTETSKYIIRPFKYYMHQNAKKHFHSFSLKCRCWLNGLILCTDSGIISGYGTKK